MVTHYRAAAPETLRIVPLDALTLVYHRSSGITHIVDAPVPEILETLGGTVNPPQQGPPPQGTAASPTTPGAPVPPTTPNDAPRMGAGGGVIHEVGCVRMGDDPRTSVLDAFCRAHHVPNLFVADGGPFVSHADKNPTHTIIALAWRTAEYLASELKKANV